LRVKLQFQEKSNWFLGHSTNAYYAMTVQQLLANSGLVEVSHPSYLLALAPDSFPLRKVETVLKGGFYWIISTLRRT
jgi:hypothetical protein